jgi:SAM-dependent methyltransferase
LFLDADKGRKPQEIAMRTGEYQGRTAARTSDQILGEIRDYCRATRTAESTFGRLVVNDGKLVSRLRDGAKITTGTLDKVRAYLTEHRTASPLARNKPAAAVKPVNGAAALADVVPAGFRFFDNRQKYLLFVSTCSEKSEIAHRISLELGNLQPTPPALRIFDAGVGDGTVLSRVMRALHARFPTMPLYVVAKEISYEDVRLTLEKMADRLFEHPATVLVITNLYYAEAPWLTPRSATSAQSLIWKDVALSGNTAHGFAEQIGQLEGFLAENWRAGISPTTGNPVYTRPIILTLRREDHSFLLDPIMPRPGRVMADYDLVIASQPYRARASVEFKASKVVAPLVRSLRPGGRLIGIHSHGDDPGMEIIDGVWPGDNPFTLDRHAILRQVKHELGAEARHYNFNASSDARSIFRYRMHTLPDEVSGPIGTSTLFAAWNAAIYVAQIEDIRLSEVVRDGRYLEATDRVLKRHGGLWFNDETYVISRRRA